MSVSNAAKRCLRKSGVNVSYTTCNSPDLYHIEEVWAIMKMKITKIPNNRTNVGIRYTQCGTPFRADQLRLFLQFNADSVPGVYNANGWYDDNFTQC